MSMTLIGSLATTEPLAEVFSDNSVVQAALAFEISLARVEARLGIIPATAAEAIEAIGRAHPFDMAEMARDTQRSATIGVPFSKALTEAVRAKDAGAASFVHWGATSQDLADTVLVLLLRRARSVLLADASRLDVALGRLANEHAKTVMLGRTLLQAAPPITFGLKAAGWLGAMRRSVARLQVAFSEALVLQFGGATGTLAALGHRGVEVGQALAEELGLKYPAAPWHTQRDRLAAAVCACGVLTGSLGKMARDISLMSQNEVREVFEPTAPGRGGSSTMPHKRNPVGSVVTLAAANRVPGLVANFLSGMVQEHERAAGGWQAEWTTIAAVLQATGLALASMAEVAEGIVVGDQQMRANIEATHGAVFAERATMLLSPALGRERAHKILEEAVRCSAAEGKSLADILREIPEVAKIVDASILASIEDPHDYLGVADEFRKRVLAERSNFNGQ